MFNGGHDSSMAAGSLDTIVTEWIELPMTLDKSLWIDPWDRARGVSRSCAPLLVPWMG